MNKKIIFFAAVGIVVPALLVVLFNMSNSTMRRTYTEEEKVRRPDASITYRSTGNDNLNMIGVIFTRDTADGSDVIWYDVASQKEKVLFHNSKGGIITDGFGYLPSPDGRWLFLWIPNELYLISLPEAKTTRIGEIDEFSKGMYLLPFWRSETHLDLEGEQATTTLNVETGSLSKPLPGLIAESYAEHEDRLVDYCRRHYGKQLRLWLSSFRKLREFDEQFDLDAFSKKYHISSSQSKEYILLRSLGIPGLGLLRPYLAGERLQPRVINMACSPDGRVVANSSVFGCRIKVHPRVEDWGKPGVKGFKYVEFAAGASLDIFEVKTKALLWSAAVAPIEYPTRYLGQEEVVRQRPFDFSMPSFENLRFTRDGRFLSFTIFNESLDCSLSIGIVDIYRGEEVLHIHNAYNAFVIVY